MISSLYEKFRHWSDKGTVWLYSDPHFGDEELRAAVERPTDDELVRRINSKVGKNDTLIILGDVGDIAPVRRLKGYKVLVCGNHDKGASNYQRLYEYRSYYQDQPKKKIIKKLEKEFPNWNYQIDDMPDVIGFWNEYLVALDNGLFDEVYSGPLMISEKILLSHEPIDVMWAYNIHGHVHDKSIGNSWNSYNVCADVIDFTPVSLNALIKTGIVNQIPSIHRITIDKATERSKSE